MLSLPVNKVLSSCYIWFIFTIPPRFQSGGIVRGSRRDRLLSKFVENECEKIDRLMELYMR